MRVYNEKETQDLLRQAAALQAARRDFTTGLTLDEIRRVAEEAGIDPRFVEQAAMGAPPPLRAQQKVGFLGGAYKLETERIVGHEVDAEEWGEMVHEIRRAFGTPGEVHEVGRGFEWMYGYTQLGSGYVYGHVSVSPRRGTTRIQASRKLANESAIFVLPFVLLTFTLIAAGLALGTALPVVLPLLLTLATALSFWGSRAWFGKMSRGAQQKLEALMARLEEIAGESEHYAAERAATPATEPRLDTRLLDEEAGDASAPAPDRRRVR